MRRGLMVCFALAAFALTLGFAVHAADSSKPVSASQPASQAAAPERPLKIAFNPEQYDAVKDYVRPGDLIFAFCVRDPGRDASGQFAPTWAPEKFARRIPLVDGLADTRLERTVVLSSIEDLAAHAGEIPKSFRYVSYNTEPPMTPPAEMANLVESVKKFARLAHEKGLKVGWGPTLTMMEQTPNLTELAKVLDSVGLQHQAILQARGVEAFAEATRKRAAEWRAVNPNIEITVQVGIERCGPDACIEAGKAVRGVIDRLALWSMQDAEGTRRVMAALREEQRSE